MSLSDVSKRLPDLSVSIGGLTLPSPLIIASGLWPHDASFWQEPYSEGVGAICSKGLTRRPRAGNSGIRIWETPSGVLNSIGLQNRGVEVFIKEELPHLSKSGIPVIVNLAVESLEETTESLVLLKSVEKDISAVELNVSCPNVDCGGMAWGMSADGVSSVLGVARKVWEGELWVKLTPQAFDLPAVGRAAEGGGADALVVSNTWLGMAIDVEAKKPVFDRIFAGLSGPAVFPLALRCLYEVAGSVSIPVIGCGGVCSDEDVLAMLLAGAAAVEIGSMLMHDLKCISNIHESLTKRMALWGVGSVADIIGKGRGDHF